MPPLADLTGQRFNRLVAKSRAGKNSVGHNQWVCICDCGKETLATVGALRSGNTKSCGCLISDTMAQLNRERSTHGMSRTPIYQAWNAMHQRCTNPNTENYSDYGGRGITVCERWNTFENFYADMGDKPGEEYTIERRNVNGNYEPNNCYWATMETQANNRRNSVLYNYNGEVGSASEFSRKYNVNLSMLEYRLAHGWSINQAIETPSRKKQDA